jgi:hypothetical protein
LLDLPIFKTSPFSGRVIEFTAERGARSESMDWVLCKPGLEPKRGGDEDRMPVVEVGIGVGYLPWAFSRSSGGEWALLLEGRGKPGEEENGSNAGSRLGAGRFTPAVDGRSGWELIFLGEESIIVDIYLISGAECRRSFQRGLQRARRDRIHGWYWGIGSCDEDFEE